MTRLTFTYDQRARKPHYKVGPSDIEDEEIEEAFSGPMVVIGQRGSVLKAVGRTLRGRFLTVVFIRRRRGQCHVITAWPSRRKQILLWHRGMGGK